MTVRLPNKQYNLAAPGSLAVKLSTYQRRRMYERFIAATAVKPDDTILDVGATADRSYDSSNYLEQWYPRKAAITAAEWTMSKLRSANGSASPLARTNRSPGWSCSRKAASSIPAAVIAALRGYHCSR